MEDRPEIREDTVLAIVINPTEKPDQHETIWGFSDHQRATDALYTYVAAGYERKDGWALTLLEILTSVVEGIKGEYPEFAAKVRQVNIEYIKNEKSDESDD